MCVVSVQEPPKLGARDPNPVSGTEPGPGTRTPCHGPKKTPCHGPEPRLRDPTEPAGRCVGRYLLTPRSLPAPGYFLGALGPPTYVLGYGWLTTSVAEYWTRVPVYAHRYRWLAPTVVWAVWVPAAWTQLARRLWR